MELFVVSGFMLVIFEFLLPQLVVMVVLHSSSNCPHNSDSLHIFGHTNLPHLPNLPHLSLHHDAILPNQRHAPWAPRDATGAQALGAGQAAHGGTEGVLLRLGAVTTTRTATGATNTAQHGHVACSEEDLDGRITCQAPGTRNGDVMGQLKTSIFYIIYIYIYIYIYILSYIPSTDNDR